jgi:hypothetical protein
MSISGNMLLFVVVVVHIAVDVVVAVVVES